MKNIFLVCLSLIVGTALYGQKTSVGLQAGPMLYQGDLVPGIVSLKAMSVGAGINFQHEFNKWVSFRATVNAGKIKGDDSFYDIPERTQRGYSFVANIWSATTAVEWDILHRVRFDANGLFERSWAPYIGIGVGVIGANPTVSHQNDITPKLATDLSYEQKPAIMIPLTLGIKRHVSMHWTVAGFATFYGIDSDYIDGISKSASPNQNDTMIFGGLSFNYYFKVPTPILNDDGM